MLHLGGMSSLLATWSFARSFCRCSASRCDKILFCVQQYFTSHFVEQASTIQHLCCCCWFFHLIILSNFSSLRLCFLLVWVLEVISFGRSDGSAGLDATHNCSDTRNWWNRESSCFPIRQSRPLRSGGISRSS